MAFFSQSAPLASMTCLRGSGAPTPDADPARTEGTSDMTKPVRFLIPIVIAVVLGPLIAGLAVCLLAIGTSIFDHTGSLPIADLFPMFGVYIVFAYLNGGVVALLA